MSQERAHTHASASDSTRDEDREELVVGRISRSALLRRPEHAVISGLLWRKARDANGVADGAEHAVAAASSSSGSRLPDLLMRKFESSLGADLSGVRVHTGSDSAAANDAVGARAYTTGNDIHFGAGQFDPSSPQGEHLLAHEVAHTVQQGSGAQRMQFKLDVSSPGDAHEHEADSAADAMVAGRAASVSFGSGVARKVMRDAKPTTTGVSWQAPFNLGTATTRAQARSGVERIYDMLLDAKTKLDSKDAAQAAMVAALDPQIDALVTCIKTIPSKDDLDAQDLVTIKNAVPSAIAVFDAHAQALAAKAKAGTKKLKAQHLVAEAAAAEKLHAMYMAGEQTDEKSGKTVEFMKAAFEQVASINDKIVELAETWGEADAFSVIPTPVEFVGTYLKPIGTAVTYATTAYDVLSALCKVIGTPAQGDLANAEAFKLGLVGITAATSILSAVPVVGPLITGFYVPAAEHCLDYLKKQMNAESSQAAELQLFDWMKEQGKKAPGVTPTIDPKYAKSFPGGQVVLDVMFPIVNHRSPAITPAARTYFMDNKSWFNNGLGAGNKLVDDMAADAVLSWLKFNSDMVWAALYGSLPKTLS